MRAVATRFEASERTEAVNPYRSCSNIVPGGTMLRLFGVRIPNTDSGHASLTSNKPIAVKYQVSLDLYAGELYTLGTDRALIE